MCFPHFLYKSFFRLWHNKLIFYFPFFLCFCFIDHKWKGDQWNKNTIKMDKNIFWTCVAGKVLWKPYSKPCIKANKTNVLILVIYDVIEKKQRGLCEIKMRETLVIFWLTIISEKNRYSEWMDKKNFWETATAGTKKKAIMKRYFSTLLKS